MSFELFCCCLTLISYSSPEKQRAHRADTCALLPADAWICQYFSCLAPSCPGWALGTAPPGSANAIRSSAGGFYEKILVCGVGVQCPAITFWLDPQGYHIHYWGRICAYDSAVHEAYRSPNCIRNNDFEKGLCHLTYYILKVSRNWLFQMNTSWPFIGIYRRGEEYFLILFGGAEESVGYIKPAFRYGRIVY